MVVKKSDIKMKIETLLKSVNERALLRSLFYAE